MKQHNTYSVGIYCRLSRDDDNDTESESIHNQKRMLAKYVEDQGWSIYNCYIDDGISGTTFNRPGFIRMLADIDSKKINLVITKDLSRLGRDYILTGHYIEIYFPERNIRYIALNDGIDTQKSDNDIAPFKNILNEMYAKDISRKVRSVFKNKVQNGEFIGSSPPYGYKKSPDNKNKLIIDHPAAAIVRRIYSMALEGWGLNKIARKLNEEAIPNPTIYKKLSGLTYVNNLRKDKTGYWTNSTIRKILNNKVYLGMLVQGKQRTQSYKCKKKINCSENDWVAVEETHQPIIERDTWEGVRKMLSVRKREMNCGETHLFSGLIWCADCERFMALGRKGPAYQYFVCGTYKNYGAECCSRHGIRYDHLYQLVLEDIKYHGEQIQYDRDAIVERLIAVDSYRLGNVNKGIAELKREAAGIEARINEIDHILKTMYEDKLKGKLSENRFNQFCSQYEEEQVSLQTMGQGIYERMKQFQQAPRDIGFRLEIIKKYTDITELDKTIVNELIEKITIGERKKIDGEIIQDVNIVYKFAGIAAE